MEVRSGGAGGQVPSQGRTVVGPWRPITVVSSLSPVECRGLLQDALRSPNRRLRAYKRSRSGMVGVVVGSHVRARLVGYVGPLPIVVSGHLEDDGSGHARLQARVGPSIAAAVGLAAWVLVGLVGLIAFLASRLASGNANWAGVVFFAVFLGLGVMVGGVGLRGLGDQRRDAADRLLHAMRGEATQASVG